MADSYKARRSKLKAHGMGENRHNKGLARILKEKRLDQQYSFSRSQSGNTKKKREERND